MLTGGGGGGGGGDWGHRGDRLISRNQNMVVVVVFITSPAGDLNVELVSS